MKRLLIIACIMSTGCTLAPDRSNVHYFHLSSPSISNDGLDPVCVEGEWDAGPVVLSAAGCRDLTGFRDELLKVGMKVPIHGY
jgi:hypothetical protein